MFSRASEKLVSKDGHPTPSPLDDLEPPVSQDTVVQLTENFRLNPDLGEFVSTIYARQFKPQKVQARQLAAALRLIASDREGFGIHPEILGPVQTFLIALSDVMYRQPQEVLFAPESHSTIPQESLFTETSNISLTHRPVSLALIRLNTWSSRTEHVGYELHVHGEAAVAAALVASLRRCSPNDDIFVATPHRIQREAVKVALSRVKANEEQLEETFGQLHLSLDAPKSKVTVDTIERLQGSEAAFVICLFSLPQGSTSDLGFLLERRRLNVAISRAKTLCILISSEEVLCPPVKVLANEETAKGYAFLKAFEKRAWSYNLALDLDVLS
ncbi:AAA domain-containing protein [Crassisporium funariophilum]|nr:AAA domain-containing protein [Crassisporium funariophilum]